MARKRVPKAVAEAVSEGVKTEALVKMADSLIKNGPNVPQSKAMEAGKAEQ